MYIDKHHENPPLLLRCLAKKTETLRTPEHGVDRVVARLPHLSGLHAKLRKDLLVTEELGHVGRVVAKRVGLEQRIWVSGGTEGGELQPINAGEQRPTRYKLTPHFLRMS